MSWEERWREGHTPWDEGGSPPVLHELVGAGTLPEGHALVPGCGSGYDVLTLASPRRRVVGLEVAPTAVRRFERLRREHGVSPEHARVEMADFFEWEPPAPLALIWDYTFLCAIDPERRDDWARRVDAWLGPGGELVTLVFPVVDRDPNEGPPYPMSPERVRELLSPRFEPTVLEPVARSHPSRQGKEWLGRWRRPGETR